MKNVLLLVHRIPFPPDKGDKIRSYHLLRHLASRYKVLLGAFVDDPDDWRHADQLKQWCTEVCLRPLRKPLALARSVTSFVSGLPLSIPYYRDPGMSDWVEHVQRRTAIDCVLVFSSTMAQYLRHERPLRTRWIADLVDVDSDKWRQYAQSRTGVRRWLYAREAAQMARYERTVVQRCDHSFLVSNPEADLLRSANPDLSERIDWYSNGVDTDYFDPARAPCEQPSADGPTIVFTGAMDYWANVDAMTWFARTVLPQVRRVNPAVRLLIVGSRPTVEVQALAADPAVTVTGRVADVRPFLQRADLAVAPLRIARGIQNKVLEAMAMRLPVVCTTAAAQGIDLRSGVERDVDVTDDPQAFAQAVVARLGSSRSDANRAFVVQRYSWPAQFERLDRVLTASAATASNGPT
jgi:sugar transferase (PEP-CTERM/EpsH1 system associated)